MYIVDTFEENCECFECFFFSFFVQYINCSCSKNIVVKSVFYLTGENVVVVGGELFHLKNVML